MYTFRELQKYAKETIKGKELRLAVLGNCATQFFSDAIQGAIRAKGINGIVYDSDYNQIDALLLDKESDVYSFKPNIFVLWLSTEKIYEEFLDSALSDRTSFAELYISKIENYWNLIKSNCNAKIIQLNFSEINDNWLGNYSNKVSSSFSFQVRKLNYMLSEKMSRRNDIYPIDLLSIQIRLGEKYSDAPLYYNAKMAVAINTLPYIAEEVSKVVAVINGNIKKCIICDLDNTLWGGVIGDDGLGGIEIGELGQGHAFSNLQRWLKQLKECGIILAVCSKNNEETARDVFENHEDMILRMDDISVFVANWEDKASNIKMIQKSLNIGMDSIVFLDDNPFERNLVRELIPEITVPELPEDPALYLGFLQHENLFESISFAGEGADRTKQYQAEFERRKMEMTFESIDDYLLNLEMVGDAKPFEPVKYARIAELTQRSNQFNLRTVRYTESDIERIANDNSYITLYYTLKDKFGDHGLVSVVILNKRNEKTVFVDTWLMSCRVLKRGMEEFIINNMIDVVKEAGYTFVDAEYIPTEKNKMVEQIYADMGFSQAGENRYILDVNDYIYKKNYIKKEDR